MASKKVYLRRKTIDSYLPKEVRAESVMKLSSVFVNRQPLKGFDLEDEKKYLNGLLDVDPANHDWPKHAKNFWTNLTIKVGFEGVELEVGADDKGNPIQIMDFINYHFALRHPHVSLTEEDMNKNYQKRFFIQDKSKDVLKKNATVQVKKDADREFIKLSTDKKEMIWVLRLMSSTNPDVLSREQIENSLYDIKEKQPKKFLRIAQDKNLSMKAEIEEMVSASVLRKIGNQVIFIDEILGDTLDDTVLHLKDKKNSGKLTILRAKLKELAI
tara:strand:- start:3046 stop:3858 length:813 start_codon:yes stop_codon:yes gene_type:complete